MSDAKDRAGRSVPVDLTKAVALYSKSGECKLFKTNVALSIEDGTLVKPFGLNAVLCSSDGYKAQARGGGLQVVPADSVPVAGVPEANPYVRRNDKTGQVLEVYSRSIAFGFSEMGVATVACKTVVFDLGTYQAVDLMAKVDKNPGDFRIVPVGVDVPDKMWAVYPLDDSTVLQANTQCKEYGKWMRQMLNRRRKAVEIAQTFSHRNATKSHPLVTFHKMDSGSSIVVPMICWRAVSGEMRWDGSQFKMLSEHLTNLADGTADPKAAEVEVVDDGKEAEALHDEHEVIEAEAQVAPDQDDLPWFDDEGKERKSDRERLEAEIRTMRDNNPDAFRRACKSADIKEDTILDTLSEGQIISMHGYMAEIEKKELR